jgi:hypothetical protein
MSHNHYFKLNLICYGECYQTINQLKQTDEIQKNTT